MKEKSRLYNVLRNIQYGLISQVLAIVFSFINRTIFIKILGSAYLGINGLFTDILTMLSLADLGLETAMVYSFYEPLAKKDYIKISSLVNFYKRIYEYIAIVVIVIGIGLLPFLKYIINLNNGIPYIKFYYLLFVLNTAASYIYIYKASIVTADQKNYIVSIYQSVSKMLVLIMQCILLLIFKKYVLYLFLQIVGTVLTNIIISRKVDKLYPKLVSTAPRLISEEKKKIFENIKSVFIYKVSGVLLNGTDNTLISMLIGTVWVGYYSNYMMIINGLNGVTSIIFNSTVASIGNVVVTESEHKRKEIFDKVQLVSLGITMITTTCLYLLFNDFIKIWIGSKYILSNEIIVSIVINYYLAGILQPVWIYRQATGIYKQTKYIMLICAIVNVFLSVIMGMLLGMSGILLASAISRILTYFWYEPRLLFKYYLGSKELGFFLQIILNFCVIVIIIYVMNKVSMYIIVKDFIGFLLKSIVIGGFSCVISFIMYGRKLIKSKGEYK